MKSENNFSRAFIDLAKMGRTDWKTIALTIVTVELLKIVVFVICGVFLTRVTDLVDTASRNFVSDKLFHIPHADMIVLNVSGAAATIFASWIGCKFIMRRPFRSLISTDMTFNIRRCFLGAAVYLPANVLCLLATSLFFSLRAGAWLAPIRHFQWPPRHDQIVVSIGQLIVIPFLAFAEELTFRGWLTQVLGQYIRPILIIVLLVAMLFAATHLQYDLEGMVLVMLYSVGLSALSLRDQRLELAIGAHAMNNVFVTLQALLFSGALPHVLNPITTLDGWIMMFLKGGLPYALTYWLFEKTNGWFLPIDARIETSGSVQPIHLES